ncbi:MAG: hypothetical protein PHS88_04045, partial [Candidatus Omnitrophica bacterium]|nr:hypothetical protein [Candidatus Omnitrophota bacterium]
MKELSVGKETSISRFTDLFPSFAGGVEGKYSVTLHLAHILNRRWEYLSGRMPGPESDYGSHRIPLTNELGVIVYGWHRLAADLQVEVAEACRQWLDGSKAMSKEEVVAHLKSDDPRALLQEADRVRQAFCGNAVHLRGLIEFSNHCQRDCLYCGLRRSNQKLPRYRMSADEIFESAKQAGA